MKHFSHQEKKYLDIAGIVALALLCIAAAWVFVATFNQTYRDRELQPEYHTTIPIYTWMTFNYLNVVFKLPPTYLQQQLAITNSRYPNIRIDTYAKEQQLDPQTFLMLVQQDISHYSPSAH